MTTPVAETIELAGGPTAVLWRRSSRARRVSLRIDVRTASVVVTLPERAARAAGMRLLSDNSGWVRAKLAALPPTLAFVEGACVPVAGEPHLIRHKPGSRGGAWIVEGEIHVAGEAEFLARRVGDLLRAEARRRLSVLVAEVAGRAGLQPSRMAIRDTRSRWGSCSPDRVVMFNWRLVMAPPAVQHYVVAHEIAHLRHMDHSRAFWAVVRTLAPDMAACEAWLKRSGAGLLRAGSDLAG